MNIGSCICYFGCLMLSMESCQGLKRPAYSIVEKNMAKIRNNWLVNEGIRLAGGNPKLERV